MSNTKDYADWVKRCIMTTDTDRTRKRGQLIWQDYVSNDIKCFGLSQHDAQVKNIRRLRIKDAPKT